MKPLSAEIPVSITLVSGTGSITNTAVHILKWPISDYDFYHDSKSFSLVPDSIIIEKKIPGYSF